MSWLSLRRGLSLACLAAFGLAIAGCGPGVAWGVWLFAASLGLGALTLSGCSESHGPGDDAGVRADTSVRGGTYEDCCEDGRLSTCFCPAGTICNYGAYTYCGGDTCGYGGCPDAGTDAATAVDAGSDAGGDWEPCCVDGVITTCFCPAASECNYGWYSDCGDGTCAFDTCGDAGAP